MRTRRVRRQRPPASKKRKAWTTVLVCLVLLLVGVILLDVKLRPAIVEIAGAELEAIISDEVNRVCAEDALDGKAAYSDLITFQYDEGGNLIGLTTNMAELNALKASITSSVSEKLECLGKTEIYVPLGTATGVAIFSGIGPMIPVEVLSVNRINSQFESNFEAAGINQTRHQIEMLITVDVVLLLPGGSCQESCTNQITVAESVLMGDVPTNYSYFSQFDSASDASAAYHDYGTE